MKLLSPNEVKSSFVNKQATDVVQVGYMKRVLADLQKNINTETGKFEENMSNQRKVYGEEKEALQGEIKALEGILEAKRAERASLMIPVDSLRNEAETLVKSIQQREQELVKEQEDLEDKLELVKEKLDRLTEREEEIATKEVSLISRKIGIDEETEQVSEGHKRLNQMMIDFNKEVSLKTTELATRESILKIEKKGIEERIRTREEELRLQEVGLADKRKALERAFEEVRRLQNKN